MSCEKCNGIGFITVPHRDGNGSGETRCQCNPPKDAASIQAQADDFARAARQMTRWKGSKIEAGQVREACEGSATCGELRRAVESLISTDASRAVSPLKLLTIRIRNERALSEQARSDREREKAASLHLCSNPECCHGGFIEVDDADGPHAALCPVCHPKGPAPNDASAKVKQQEPAPVQGR